VARQKKATALLEQVAKGRFNPALAAEILGVSRKKLGEKLAKYLASANSREEEKAMDRLRLEDAIIVNHLIAGRWIIPAAYMLAHAARQLDGHVQIGKRQGLHLSQVVFKKPPEVRGAYPIQTRIDDDTRFRFCSDDETLAEGRYAVTDSPASHLDLAQFQLLPLRGFYARVKPLGYGYGPLLRVVDRTCDDGPRAVYRLKNQGSPEQPGLIDPFLLDGVFQCLLHAAGVENLMQAESVMFLPYKIQGLRLYRPMPATCHALIERSALRVSGQEIRGSVRVYSKSGKPVLDLEDMVLIKLTTALANPNDHRFADNAIHAYIPDWRPAAPVADDGRPLLPIVVGGGRPELAAALAARHGRVVRLYPAEVFAQIGGDEFRLPFTSPEAWPQFLAHLPATALPLFVYDEAFAAGLDSTAADAAMAGLLALCRSLITQSVKARVRIPTLQALSVAPGDSLAGYAAGGIAGFLRTLRLESVIDGTQIDLDDANGLAAAVLAECGPQTEAAVAYRDGVRRVPTYRPVSFNTVELSHDTSLSVLPPVGESLLGRGGHRWGCSKNAAASLFDRPHPSLPPSGEGARMSATTLISTTLPAPLGDPWQLRPGVYIVAGGAGGIGRKLCLYLAARYDGLHFAWLGRGPYDRDKEEAAMAVRALGGQVDYFQADLTDAKETAAAIAAIRKLGTVRGLIHSGGSNEESLIRGKDWPSFARVYHAKARGIELLDRLTADLPLDFFVAFASTIGLTGSVGQCDYSAANALLDSFVHWRNRQKDRRGRAIAIDWTLWHDGGMGLDDGVRQKFLKKTGVIRAALAFPLLERILAGPHAEIAVAGNDRYFQSEVGPVEAIPSKVEDTLAVSVAVPSTTWEDNGVKSSCGGSSPRQGERSEGWPGSMAMDGAQTRPVTSLSLDSGIPCRNDGREDETPALPVAQRFTETLCGTLAGLLSVETSEIDGDTDLRELGLDSIAISAFSAKMEEDWGVRIDTTLLYEYSTLREVAAAVAASQDNALATTLGVQADTPSQPLVAMDTPASRPQADRRASPPDHGRPTGTTLDIAIIGLTGRYPGHDDVEGYWQALMEGQDLIGEIPPERWDWRRYFGDPKEGEDSKTYSKWGGFLDDIHRFDAEFFRISPREAELMDPQQRLLLEEAWHLLEDAGYAPSALAGSETGVYIGISNDDYSNLLTRDHVKEQLYTATGSYLSIAANRISFFLGLKGPSLSIDTACASSLVAICQAVSALRAGECSQAIAGGVNLCITPRRFMAFSHAGMLSPDGRCKTFDSSANGYVRGEGVGLVLLKPAQQAISDGDYIYGIIKGSRVNHGGLNTTITAPSAQAQAELIVAAMTQANLDPAGISLMEAHGTGTPLGDPLEVRGLKKAFAELYQQRGKAEPATPHVAIGAVKTNIGHLEAASGIAGLSKVLMGMKYGYIPKNLHFQQQNPAIDLRDSPFYFPSETRPWTTPLDEAGRPHPRRAGVSSFGFGGANAHLIVEAYANERQACAASTEALVFPLSAASATALRRQAERLADFLNAARAGTLGLPPNLHDIAYTLQTGREALEYRAALCARDIDALIAALRSLAHGDTDSRPIWTGQVPRRRGNALASQGPLPTAPEAIAAYWVQGGEVPWPLPTVSGRRTPLPGYPFEGEAFWMPEPNPDRSHAPRGNDINTHGSHALRGNDACTAPRCESTQNTGRENDDPSALRCEPARDAERPGMRYHAEPGNDGEFHISLNGQEFFLAQHRVEDRPVLPGAAFVEMARDAGDRTGRKILALEKIHWASPVVGNPGADIVLRLTPEGDRFHCEALSSDGRLHAQCRLAEGSPQPAARLDSDACRARCPTAIDVADFYVRLETLGLQIRGGAFQTIRELRAGSDEVWARLELEPAYVQDAMALHPALLDGAFQTCYALFFAAGDTRLQVPFAAERIDIAAPLSRRCWVQARRTRESAQGISYFDVSLADENGQVLATVTDFVARPYPTRRIASLPGNDFIPPFEKRGPGGACGAGDCRKVSEIPPSPPFSKGGEPASLSALLGFPVWQPATPPLRELDPTLPIVLFDSGEEHRQTLVQRYGRAVILVKPGAAFRLCEPGVYELVPHQPEDYRRLLAELAGFTATLGGVVYLWGNAEIAADPVVGVFQPLFLLTQALAASTLNAKLRIVLPYRNNADTRSTAHDAVAGFARAYAKERPSPAFTLLATATAPTPELMLRALGWDVPSGERFRAEEEAIEHLEYSALEPTATETGATLRHGGCYLITGGQGALGQALAGFLCERYGAKVMLAGRAAAGAETGVLLARLNGLGGEAHYQAADLGQASAVEFLIEACIEAFGTLHGVFHLAGQHHDRALPDKSLDEALAVLEPKVAGTLHLDRATAQLPLDFFCLYSSLAALLGIAGQTDYAYANAFLDGFVAAREAQRTQGQRRGLTLAIHWPYWRDGGMKLEAQTEAWFREVHGLRPLETAEGLAILAQALEKGWRRVAVSPKALPEAVVPVTVGEAPDRERLAGEIGEMVKQLLKIRSFDASKHLEDYGADSISLTELTNAINRRYGLKLTPVIFFEYPTVAGLLDHLESQLHRSHAPRGNAACTAPRCESTRDAEPENDAEISRRVGTAHQNAPSLETASLRYEPIRDAERPGRHSHAERGNDNAIAIVGMAGVMPGSADLAQFWENLANGLDLVTEVPPERWDWRAYDGDPATDPNRTHCRWGGFMPGIDRFDHEFFGLTKREAMLMDPQQRLLLALTWHAIEDAGHKPSDLAGTDTGVYMGVSTFDYYDLIKNHQLDIEAHTATGVVHSILANRISWFYDLRGPSFPIDTACSSSLLAIHQALEAIAAGSCRAALVGGINLLLSPTIHISFGKAGMLSPDGRCKTFDASADGYVRSEGAAVLYLKPLADALADGDPVYAVLRGSATNHGGRAKSLTAPNPNAQADLITLAQRRAGIDPATITYIEAHGTGTGLGDPIELQGLKKAFARRFEELGKQPDSAGWCGIGSVKTNIGHLEAGAGLAGLCKILLAMQHGELPPIIHQQQENPYIDLADSPFYLVKQRTPWPRLRDGDGRAVPRRAGISSFGFGGANAHVVLEEYLAPQPLPRTASGPFLLVLSARNEERLREQARNLAEHLSRTQPSPEQLADIAYTLQVGREAMAARLALLVSNGEEAAARLTAFAEHGTIGVTDRSHAPRGNVALDAPRPVFQHVGWVRRATAALADGYDISARRNPTQDADHPLGYDAHVSQLQSTLMAESASNPTYALGDRSRALRGNEALDAPRPVFQALTSSTVDEVGYNTLRDAERSSLYTSVFHTVTPAGSAGVHGQGRCSLRAPAPSLAMDSGIPCRKDEALGYRQHLCIKASAERGNDGTFGPNSWHGQAEENAPAPVTGDLAAIAAAFVRGANIDWQNLHDGSRRRVRLPGYSFATTRCWLPLPTENPPEGGVPKPRTAPVQQGALDEFQRGFERLEELATTGLIQELAGLGVLREEQARYHWPALRPAKLAPQMERLFDSLPYALVQRGLADYQQGILSPRQPNLVTAALERDLDAENRALAESHPELAAHCRLLSHCLAYFTAVLLGEAPGTEALFPDADDSLVRDIYRNNPHADYLNRLAAQRLAEGYAGGAFHVLEVGAGTGGATAAALATLAGRAGAEYTYTDVSRHFLEAGRSQFDGKGHPLHFAVLDLEQDPLVQGFAPASFDAILAANVLHATRRVDQTLRRLAVLLKPGGRIVFNELTRPPVFVTLTFGLLDGWWRYDAEETRCPGSPLLDLDRWRTVLEDAGFEGVSIHGGEAAGALEQHVIEARRARKLNAVADDRSHALRGNAACTAPRCEAVQDEECVGFAGSQAPAWEPRLGSSSFPESATSEADNGKPELTVLHSRSLSDSASRRLSQAGAWERAKSAGHPLGYDAHEARLQSTAMVQSASNPIYALEHITAILEEELQTALRETSPIPLDRAFVDLGIDSIFGVGLIGRLNKKLGLALKPNALFDHPTPHQLAVHLAEAVADRSYAGRGNDNNPHGSHAPRGNPPPTALRWGAAQDEERLVGNQQPQVIQDAERPGMHSHAERGNDEICLAIRIEAPTQPALLRPVRIPAPQPGPGALIIRVHAFSLNYGDLLCIKGVYPSMPPYPFTPGMEVAGEVAAVGQGISGFAPGDRVMALTGAHFGGHASLALAEADAAVHLPPEMPYTEAVAFPVGYLVMSRALELADVGPGDRVLIQSAAGGVGVIGVQLARKRGAEVFVTAGADDKLDFLAKLGAQYGINYQREDFAARIRALTGGAGVDVVINNLGGDAMQNGLDLLAPGGRYVETAMMALRTTETLDFSRLVDNQAYFSFDLRRFLAGNPLKAQQAMMDMARTLAEGRIKPVVAKVFPFEQIGQAYAWVEARRNIGRVVVAVPQALTDPPASRAGSQAPAWEPGLGGSSFQEPATSRARDGKLEPLRQAQDRLPLPRSQAGVWERAAVGDIAVIGLAGRYPGAADLDAFWRLLAEGRNGVSEVPAARWPIEAYYSPKLREPGRTYCRHGGFLADIDLFDAAFFNLSGAEAARTDPQQRLFLETAWEALEQAGYAQARKARCGVFVGVGAGDYQHRFLSKDLPPTAHVFSGNQASILAARIAYHLDLRGPALAVDTACSASLVAIHLACESLRSGESEMALAGGVFVAVTPQFHILCSQMGMLSPQGRCAAFDAAADGFVPGEGVGAIVLKPLERALADGDFVWGVIQGSGSNQDGATNGITAPSGNSQTELERQVYRRFGIDAHAIGYIETHGTGTPLGDPVEIEALRETFQGHAGNKIALGSVKSNIGHAATAAGIAGITKALLALHHGQIPPSLHFLAANPLIDFAASPFHVNTRLQAWPAPADGPRLAAVSAFGFSGTNSHIVLAEAPPLPLQAEAASFPTLVCCSGPRAEDARRVVARLAEFLADPPQGLRFVDLAYTLNVRRPHHAYRIVFPAADLAELRAGLARYLAGRPDAGVLEGQAGAASSQDAALAERLLDRIGGNAAQRAEVLHEWGRLFVQGVAVPWAALFAGTTPRCIPMPTYPFERRRYWVDEVDAVAKPVGWVERSETHRAEARSASIATDAVPNVTASYSPPQTLGPDWPYIRDHVVEGRALLPGVAYLEFAAARYLEARGVAATGFRDITFLRPLEVSRHNTPFRVELNTDGEFRFFAGEPETEHARGYLLATAEPIPANLNAVELNGASKPSFRQGMPETMTRDGAGARSLHRPWPWTPAFPAGVTASTAKLRVAEPAPANLPPLEQAISGLEYESADAFYARLERQGYRYGPSLRAVHALYRGADRAVARLRLPAAADPLGNFAFHPSLLDGALQAVAGSQNGERPLLPYLIGRIDRHALLESEMAAHVQTLGSGRYRLTLTRLSGEVLLVMDEICARAMADPLEKLCYRPGFRALPPVESLAVQPQGDVWVVYTPDSLPLHRHLADLHAGQTVRLLGLGGETRRLGPDEWEITPEALERVMDEWPVPQLVYFLNLPQGEVELARHEQRGVFALLRLVQVLQSRYPGLALAVKVVTGNAMDFPDSDIRPWSAGLHGFCRSAARELPETRFVCLDVDSESQAPERLAAAIVAEPGTESGGLVVLRGGQRFAPGLMPAKLPARSAGARNAYRPGGTYVILGGAGGIGLVLARHLIQTVGAKVALIGRRSPAAGPETAVAELRALGGGDACYVQADASDPVAIKAAIAHIKDRFGPIHGAFHSAIVLADRSLDRMDQATFEAALHPKAQATVHFCQALADEDLDFLLLFSSLQSFVGGPGQTNYAAGCTFQDSYAAYWRSQVAYPVRLLHWGYWGSVGVVASESYRRRLAEMGLASIEPDVGMAALDRFLASDWAQMLVVRAEQRLLEELGVRIGGVWHELPGNSGASPAEQPRPPCFPDTGETPEFPNDLKTALYALDTLESWCERCVPALLLRLGLAPVAADLPAVEVLAERWGVLPKYLPLLRALFRSLERSGYAVATANGYRLAERPIPTWNELIAEGQTLKTPAIAAFVELVLAAAENFAAVLQGRLPATEVLFPQGSDRRVRNIYRGHPIADYYNRLAGLWVRDLAENQAEPLRILEVGGGTGGTTSALLDALAGQETTYCFTDISPAPVAQARQTFPGLEYRVFDLEQDPLEQGLLPGSFDLIVAGNAVHACADIGAALGRLKVLLRPGGWLLLNELTADYRFATLSFGLTNTWWGAKDGWRRLPDSPLLAPAQWLAVLWENGFRHAGHFGLAGHAGQRLIAAQSDGHVLLRSGQALNPRPALPSEVGCGDEGTASIASLERCASLRSAHPTVLPDLCSAIADIMAQILEINAAELDWDTPHQRYGVDSILALAIVERIDTGLNVRLRSTDFFNFATIRELALHILELQPALPLGPKPEAAPASSEAALLDVFQRVAAGEIDVEAANRLILQQGFE
jgi:acyl transferase domain-containing protein/D-arabinose 1-dehydrogenase-like Zn-dependent alcohol dehydrogenase/acyl carrier protein